MGWTVYNSDGKILQSAELGDNAVTSAKIADGAIVNADINASAVIAYSKLAALADGNILVGNGSNVAVSVNPSGDVDIANDGTFSIATGAVVNADVNSSAAIAYTKLAALTDGNILVGNGSNVAVSVSPSGDIDVSNAGVLSLNSTAISGFSAKTSIADADTILLGDSAASGALKKMTKVNFVAGLGGASLSGSTNNNIVTVTGTNAMIGETTLTYDASANTNMFELTNLESATNKHARIKMRVATDSGDPVVEWSVADSNVWSLGIDNSDSDNLYLMKNSQPGQGAGDIVMKMDRDGAVTKPSQPMFFSALQSNASSCTGDGTVYSVLSGSSPAASWGTSGMGGGNLLLGVYLVEELLLLLSMDITCWVKLLV